MIKYLAILFITFLFSQCTTPSDIYYQVVGMEISNVDNTGSSIEDLQKDSVWALVYGIQLLYTVEPYDHSGAVRSKTTWKNKFKVSTIEIKVLENFDNTHPANSLLNDYFYVDDFRTIDEYIKDGIYGGNGRTAEDGLKEEWSVAEHLLLMESPSINGVYTFVIKIEQENNITLIDTTQVKLFK